MKNSFPIRVREALGSAQRPRCAFLRHGMCERVESGAGTRRTPKSDNNSTFFSVHRMKTLLLSEIILCALLLALLDCPLAVGEPPAATKAATPSPKVDL